jgi:hypothetical protein
MQIQKETSGLILLLVLSILALFCLPCQTSSQVIPTPTRTVPVSTAAAENLISKFSEGLTLDPEGCFDLKLHEEELTSYIALNMQESITDPQIILEDEKLYLYGTIVSPIEAPVAAMSSIEIERRQVKIRVEAVTLGGFPIPETFVQAFVQQVDGLINSAQRQGNVEITEIEISEGDLIIRGKVVS